MIAIPLGSRLGRYLVIFFFTVLIFFCAAIAFSETPKHRTVKQDPCQSGWIICQWKTVKITINKKHYECYVNGRDKYFYFVGDDGMTTVSDSSCYAAVNEWSHTWPTQLFRA